MFAVMVAVESPVIENKAITLTGQPEKAARSAARAASVRTTSATSAKRKIPTRTLARSAALDAPQETDRSNHDHSI